MAEMTNQEIQEYHRHRYPYLLIDSIDEMEPGKRAHGYKYFTENEWLFQCNKYEDQPVPFTMVIEILTEMFLMPILVLEDNKGKITNFLSADDVQVLKPIYPGDRLDIEVEVDTWKRGIAAGTAKGYVEGEVVCSARLKFVIPDIMNRFKPDMARKEKDQ